MVDEVIHIHCNSDWTTILEWGVFEVSTTVLLVAIFFWMMMGDVVGHCRSYLKNRGTRAQRLEKELEAATKKQQKLALKMSSAVVSFDAGSAHVSNAAPPAADVEKKASFSAV